MPCPGEQSSWEPAPLVTCWRHCWLRTRQRVRLCCGTAAGMQRQSGPGGSQQARLLQCRLLTAIMHSVWMYGCTLVGHSSALSPQGPAASTVIGPKVGTALGRAAENDHSCAGISKQEETGTPHRRDPCSSSTRCGRRQSSRAGHAGAAGRFWRICGCCMCSSVSLSYCCIDWNVCRCASLLCQSVLGNCLHVATVAAGEPDIPDAQKRCMCTEMQSTILLVAQADEESADVSSQPSKAAVKRARKKAARQRVVTADSSGQPADTAGQPKPASSPNQATVARCSSVAVADALEPEAAPVEVGLITAGCICSEALTAVPLQPLAAAADHTAAAADWWRCPLSGSVMRGPGAVWQRGPQLRAGGPGAVAGGQPWGGPAHPAAAAARGRQRGAQSRPAQLASAAAARVMPAGSDSAA
jgi:hypothetical protein